MSGQLGQSDFEDLSAWLDGELSAERAAQVERLVHEDRLWRQAERELCSLHEALDSYAAPAPAPGLARRILAGIPTRELTESELENLSAYMDGELPAEPAAAEVARGIEADAAWRQMRRDLQDVDSLLDYYTAPPASAELTGRIMSAVRKQARHRQVLRVVSWLAPAAAAAAIIIVGLAVFAGGHWFSQTQTPGIVSTPVNIEPELAESTAFQAVPVEQRPALQEEIIRHLNFFRDYEVAADLETLEAIEQLDSQDQGT
jgi:anti-sigma factor RsiW